MLFFMELGGNVIRIDADKIYQGTNDLPKIQLVTPITPDNTAIQVACTYPNGLTSIYYPMAIMGRYTLGDIVTNQDVNAPDGTQVFMWQVTMPENATLQPGTVVLTFKILKPTDVVTITRGEFPDEGEPDTYYIDSGTYYTWVPDAGVYAPINTTAYADEELTTAIGQTAQQYATEGDDADVCYAEDVQVIGDEDMTYTQTDTASTIQLDYIPNPDSITATIDGSETEAFTYNATLNRVGFTDTGTTYSVTYSLAEEPQAIAQVYFNRNDCVTLQGHYQETEDTLEAFDNAYKVVTTSPVPFTVTYAALPAPPNEATVEDVDTLVNLLSAYYEQNAAILMSRTRQYKGTIESTDWEAFGNRFYYTIPASEYNLENPIVLELLVDTDEGKGNSFYSYAVRANGDIRFTSDLAVTGHYTILGN